MHPPRHTLILTRAVAHIPTSPYAPLHPPYTRRGAQPYILGYMGRRSVVYVPAEGPTAVATATDGGAPSLTDTATAAARYT